MKDQLIDFIKKYFLTISITITLTFGTALKDFFVRFYDLPEQAKATEIKRRQDSAMYMGMYLGMVHRQDSINKVIKLNTEDDWDSIKVFAKILTNNNLR